jgi:hypothetical protein
LNEDSANRIIETQLGERAASVEAEFGGDVLVYIGPIMFGAEDGVREVLEARQKKLPDLYVLLETYGGYIEVAERVAHVLRHHYGRVHFVVPTFAMSAGTVLVMSGDSIHMDYSSILGPIDPQVQRQDTGDWIPALGYLEQFKRFVDKSNRGTLTTAELVYMTKVFDPAELYRYEQARELSITLLKEWLVSYKFRNWKKTRSRKKTVTSQMRTMRAREVAKMLNKTGRWHSHSRGITMAVLRRDLKLEIEDFGESEDKSAKIRDYFMLLKDYMGKRGHQVAFHSTAEYMGA